MMKLPGPETEAETQPPPQFIVVTNWIEELKQRVPTN
jgi:hypothetical protein